jgi:hypothetical protein
MNRESDKQKSRHMSSADILANQVNMQGSELLNLIRTTAMSPNYPTPECFLPHEVWEYEHTHQMPNGRLSHADICVNCNALLDALEPNLVLINEVRTEVLQNRSSVKESPRATKPRKVAVAYAAAAALVLVGAASLSRVTRARDFVVTNEINKKQMRVPVRTYVNGRLSEDSYPTAAAAIALMSDPVFKLTPSSDLSESQYAVNANADQLRYKIVLALASVCGQPNESVPHTQTIDTMEQALKNQRVSVKRAPSWGDEFLVNYGEDSARLESAQALSSTLHYCQLLHEQKGNALALDNGTRSVDFTSAVLR